jgi:hypothetical protein
MSDSIVDVGCRFRVVERGPYGQRARVWVIRRLFTGIDQHRYAVLVSADADKAEKTLALSAVADRKRFEAVPDTEAA